MSGRSIPLVPLTVMYVDLKYLYGDTRDFISCLFHSFDDVKTHLLLIEQLLAKCPSLRRMTIVACHAYSIHVVLCCDPMTSLGWFHNDNTVQSSSPCCCVNHRTLSLGRRYSITITVSRWHHFISPSGAVCIIFNVQSTQCDVYWISDC